MYCRRAILNLALLATFIPFASDADAKAAQSFLVYVGTYTGPQSKGIYGFRFDPASGKSTPLGSLVETTNPSFLAIDPSHRHLYAVNEVTDYKEEKSGGVSAFAIDSKTGGLTLLNQASLDEAGPGPSLFHNDG